MYSSCNINNEPLQAITEGNQVLIWSFDDCLKPKLILESKRQVTAVSFCPRNGNIVIGGCTNGQIVVWDITGKIEEVERIVVQNAAESRHETALKCLWTWMKESRECSVVRGTATSSLQFSQKGPITKIEWLSPYDKLNDRGILQDLPANTNEEDLSLQFIASSEDGTIAFWDLNWRPSEEKSVKIRSKKRKPVEKPNSLARSISRYKILDGVFKPLYILIVQNENEPRNAIITSMSVARPPNHKKLLDEDQHSENLAARRRYEVTIKKRETPLAGIFIGTARGECGLVSWEGFEFSTGITLNKEVCKWTWRKQVHDGPVSHAVRSRFLKDVILTVGGRIFAIWREDFPESLFWRKSENRYTACCWDNSSPSKIILGHNEGTVEVWDLSIKCHEPNTTQSLSGRVITGIHAHELPLYPPCVGFCDFNGALRIFIAPKNSSKFRQIDVDWMRQFVDREVNRIKDFVAWTNERKEMNKKMQEEKEAEAAKLELIQADEMKKKKITQEVGQMIATKIAKARSRKKLVDEMRARWVTRELDRMQRGILEKKGLHEEELERRYEPVKKMKEEAREKEERRRRAFGQADELFEEAVASNFPHQKEKLLSEFTLSSFGQDRPADLASIDATIPLGDDETVEDEVLKEYKIIEAQALSTMHRRSYDVDFSWRELIKAGIKRRKCLDVKLKIHKAHINHEDSSSGENSLLSDTVASSNISIRNPSVELERADSS